jgi:hypothetical protein
LEGVLRLLNGPACSSIRRRPRSRAAEPNSRSCVQCGLASEPVGAAFQKEVAVQRRIPGTVAAYSVLAVSSLFAAAAMAGVLWLTGEGAIWLGHALPRLI